MEQSAEGVKRVFLETFGCQMNDNDSERILGFLKNINYTRTSKPTDADLIILNTCSVRDKAEQKVYSALGRFKELKEERPGLILGVAGCVAQQEGKKLLKRAPYLDLVFGPQNIHRLPDLIGEISKKRGRLVAVEQSESIDENEYGLLSAADGRAFVSIMRGCDNFCAYCIVPYTRGREVSRRSADIIGEVSRLAEGGVKEVTLLGQNVNSYGAGGAEVSFPELLRLVARIDGIRRVRFITSHPKDISVGLIRLFGEEPKLARHIHLPVQSGSDRVLKAMGRGYTASHYSSKVRLIKNLHPDISVTTDIIVGFPGETEDEFEETIALLRDLRFDNIFSFMYSPRPLTKAAAFTGHVPADVRSKRLQRLQDAQRCITLERSRELVGRRVEVLLEGASTAPGEREFSGRTSCNRIVRFPYEGVLPDSIVEVVVTEAYPNSLRAEFPPQGK
ncbi:MAG: tRNA (N6-isopentenyl adenosine(37)-C2)-methylthiotransferase MiaB [Deltaproteobacteria bacterium]|nr:tRNA (N6-isopentenyl adenosine(37)-C2)-methylthiotransferase MiaB [Deltaproteobacteria bacterium]